MLGMFSLLPLLKGWSYKMHILERTIARGADPVERRIDETGWIMEVVVFSTDAYGTFSLDWQGAELESMELAFYPELAADFGAFTHDRCQLYHRPNPYSTAGLYFVNVFTGGFEGATWPYVPTSILKIYLQTASTQASAYVYGRATTIAIIDKKEFIRSLRRLFDPKASLEIDPALLAIGPSVFKEVKP